MPDAVYGRRDTRELVLVQGILIVAGVVLVAWFDLQTNLPILDEYARRWTIQKIASGQLFSPHGLNVWGFSANIIGTAVALGPALLHLEPRFWRLPALPLMVMEAVFVFLTAQHVGASRTWAALAATVAVCSPLSLSVATGMMTETAFLGLYAAAIWFCLRWLRDGRDRWWCAFMIGIAVLQRQQGIALAAVLTASLALQWNRRRLTRPDLLALAATWAWGLAALGFTFLIHYHVIQRSGFPSPHHRELFFALYVVISEVPLLGLIALPFLVGLLQRRSDDRRRSWAGAVTVPLAVCALILNVILLIAGLNNLFPGDHVTLASVGTVTLPGKPALLPAPLYPLLQLLAAATFIVALVWRRRDWTFRRLGPEGIFLIMCAAANFPFIYFEGVVIDRYYLIVTLPVLPLLARWATEPGQQWRLAKIWAVACPVVLLGYFTVGAQDYIAWQVARDGAAKMAYTQAPPWQVDAGFEENAENVWIPAVDNPGANLPHAIVNNPSLRLITTKKSDPRPGSTYDSISPGKVVVVHSNASPTR